MSALVQSTIAANELATLLIPISGKQLVLPNVTVAEIIPYSEPQLEDDEGPDWYLGEFSWRNINVPLLSFEKINGQTVNSQSTNRRIAVLNGVVDEEILPFCAIVTQGVPRLMRITPDEISNHAEAEKGPAEVSAVLIGGEPAVIPNVDFIQQQMLKIIA